MFREYLILPIHMVRPIYAVVRTVFILTAFVRNPKYHHHLTICFLAYRTTLDWSLGRSTRGNFRISIQVAEIGADGCPVWCFLIHGYISSWWYTILGPIHLIA